MKTNRLPQEAPKIFIEERKRSVLVKGGDNAAALNCDEDSLAGSVSQRACVYCGARVVLNPITDAVHLVHGPVGCASFTMDIRGSLSSGTELYRNSFSTDLSEEDVIFGGEKKLAAAIDLLVARHHPKVVFVYSTCIIGVIGDDLQAVCKAASQRNNVDVIAVESSGFMGNKAAGYRAACNVLLKAMEPQDGSLVKSKPKAINFFGEFNVAGERWIVHNYLEQMGVELNVVLTGDARYEDLKRTTHAALNIVQCAGSMNYLANKMQELYDIPFIQISFVGVGDTVDTLRKIAEALADPDITAKTEALIERELAGITPALEQYRKRLTGKKAAVYVGGGFKAISLIRQFKELGIEIVVIGTQTGMKEEYQRMATLVNDGTVILDDTNPAELTGFMMELQADLLVGGTKERGIAYKIGRGFIDHNHARQHALIGFEGAINFAKEVADTICSPVWKYIPQIGGEKHG